jgi:hypothetical protein
VDDVRRGVTLATAKALSSVEINADNSGRR